MNEFVAQFKKRARPTSAKIVFAEAEDPRILKAARKLKDENIADIILLGNPDAVELIAGEAKVSLQDLQILNPGTHSNLDQYAELYQKNKPKSRATFAIRLAKKPLYFAALMVKAGHADLMIAGNRSPTRRVIEAASLCIGLAEGSTLASSFFMMCFNDRAPLFFADCALNPDPDAAELATIAIDTGRSAERLLQTPARIALLSFSSKGSAQHRKVSTVVNALNMVHERAPELIVDGELQADAALVTSIAGKKLKETSPVAGVANVLIFPNLDAANIAYKLVQHLAHAQAIGPVLQGFARPVADLSRAVSVDEIVSTSIIALTLM